MQEEDDERSAWNRLVYDTGRRRSELCKAKDRYTGWYERWCRELNEPPRLHRKQWEFAYIMEALWERGCIGADKKGLVFAVGEEPLPSVFARYGCSILATDIHPEKGLELGWDNGSQLCFGPDSLNKRNLCPEDIFRERVSYRPVDMNHIPRELKGFDFNWSSCSLEHLGSIRNGLDFLENQLKTLQPGGWGIHTTEFNLSSNDMTQDNDTGTVVFRKRDIDEITGRLEEQGHFVEELDYSMGGLPEDYHVDLFPHDPNNHLRLQINSFVVTSIGLIIRKDGGTRKKKHLFHFLSGR